MKKNIILIFLVISLHVFSQEKQIIEYPKVDKRVELLSIVFRLAGNNEYNSTKFKLYSDKVEKHFNPYKNHELVEFARILRTEKGISYDAPMSLAISLDENLNPKSDFIENSFERWEKEDATKFVKLLQQFYKDARCDDFFKDNENLYQAVAEKFLPTFKDLDLSWYNAFYGKASSEKFIVVVSLGVGDQCYGPFYNNQNGENEVYAIMGTWQVDSSGMAEYETDKYFPYLLHEFNHSFVNPLLNKDKELFKRDGKKIFEVLNYEMSILQAYGNWETVLDEALVRASVIKYNRDHNVDQTTLNNLYKTEINNGFLWIKELVAELDKYSYNRTTYPTLESYMPEIAKAYSSYADIVEQFDSRRPKVSSIAEFENGSEDIDYNIQTIIINFDRVLIGNGYSINLGNKGKEAFPRIQSINYSEGNRSVVMGVQLEPDKEYQFILTGKSFKTPEGYPLKTYEVNFKTKK